MMEVPSGEGLGHRTSVKRRGTHNQFTYDTGNSGQGPIITDDNLLEPVAVTKETDFRSQIPTIKNLTFE